jgi:hypothetical protein
VVHFELTAWCQQPAAQHFGHSRSEVSPDRRPYGAEAMLGRGVSAGSTTLSSGHGVGSRRYGSFRVNGKCRPVQPRPVVAYWPFFERSGENHFVTWHNGQGADPNLRVFTPSTCVTSPPDRQTQAAVAASGAPLAISRQPRPRFDHRLLGLCRGDDDQRSVHGLGGLR